MTSTGVPRMRATCAGSLYCFESHRGILEMKKGTYNKYLLGLLMAILAANYVDRLVLGIVLQDMKRDLALTDTQLGFLSGIAFAIFYAVMGIPLARWADRGNRVTLIALTTGLWSVGVALCGMVGSFVQLLLIRIGVAVGEAGCVPPALSLIADYFNRAERPRAVAIYMLGGQFSYVVGYFLGGWSNEFYGWRMTFILLGAPGIVLALLAAFTLREPRHTKITSRSIDSLTPVQPARSSASSVAAPALKTVWRTLWANGTFRQMLFCNAVLFFFLNGVLQWLPTFFIRSHQMQTGELGTALAVVFSIGGFGAYLGGVLASRYAAHNECLQLKACAIAIVASAILWMAAYLSADPYLTFTLIGLGVVVQSAIVGPLYATIQSLVPESMRAMAFALVYLFANLIGMGLGPLGVGMLSDAFHAWAHEESIRYALLALGPGFFWVAWYAWRASRTVARDLAICEGRNSSLSCTPIATPVAE
jgi:MFS family permease